MTHPSKIKGNNYERELVAQARDKGLESERAYASNGRSLGESEEVDLIISGCRVQAKRRKALPAYLALNEGVDAVAFRQDKGSTLILLRLDDFLDKVKETGGW
jgi:Holliday junction resolvase